MLYIWYIWYIWYILYILYILQKLINIIYVCWVHKNMSKICKGLKKDGLPCTRKTKEDYCFQHNPETLNESKKKNVERKVKQKIEKVKKPAKQTVKRKVANVDVLKSIDANLWENAYKENIFPKYAKQSRKYTSTISGKEWTGEGNPPLYVVPRVRTESYKSVNLLGIDKNDVYYAPISKGFSMQDVSSFVMGPVVGQGLCIVNVAFSKEIAITHIEGNGKFNEKRKTFWQKARKPKYNIQILDDIYMSVDDEKVEKEEWLEKNKDEWFPEWLKWSQNVALCGLGNFHWTGDSPTVLYYNDGQYLQFVEWKKKCYIQPAYDLLPNIETFQWLKKVWLEHKRPMGLVHPKGKSDKGEEAITPEYIRELYDSEHSMSCMPYVIVGKMLEVPIY